MPGDESNRRRTGVEIEFAGMTAEQAAEIVARTLGGEVTAESAHVFEITGTQIGRVKIELDTALAKAPENPGIMDDLLSHFDLRDDAADLLKTVLPVPVELVTEPILRAEFAVLDRTCDALAAAGALGTKGGTLYAFGMHLNPAHEGTPEEAVRIAAAYAFAEPYLRAETPVDPARRVTPFVDPYPRAYLRDLATMMEGGAAPTLAAFIALYARHNPDRNRGLDLWPLLGHLDPETAAAHHKGPIKSPRPAFHYRLPDSVLGPGRNAPLDELDRWEKIEAVAADPAAFEKLRQQASLFSEGTITRPRFMMKAASILA